jgi:hypothetical protein
MAKSSLLSVAGNVFTYSVVAIVLVGGLLYLGGYVQLPFLSAEGFENEENAEETANGNGNDDGNGEGFTAQGNDHDETQEGFENGEEEEEENEGEPFVGGYGGSGAEFAPADDSNGRKAVPSSDHANCYTRDGLNPSDLLPKASPEAAQFVASNPPASGRPENRNLLQAGYHIGVDTVCQSNKNPNLQLRSDPPISRSGPQPVFNASTIPFVQNNRRVLEVGGELNPKGCADFKNDSMLP